MVKRAGGALLLGLRLDRGSDRSVSLRLCQEMRRLILNGDLQPGERLPSSRTLARELGVSRTTSLTAFDQLIAEGLLEARVGSGTFVSAALTAHRPAAPRDEPGAPTPDKMEARLARAVASASENFFRRLSHPEKPCAFVTGMPAVDEFPMAQWSRLMAKHFRGPRSLVTGYCEAEGFFPLRRAIAAHLRANRGISCEPEEVFIVNGAQQAFNVIAGLTLDPGDKVWFENPGGIGGRNSLIAAGAELIPAPVDADGLVVADAWRRAPDFRMAFVTPSHQQPLGSTMSLERRLELLRAAAEARAWIVEDDYDGEFHYSGRPLPTVKSVDKTERVFYVGTFSKTLFPALRLGFFIAPPAMIPVVQRFFNATLQGAPTCIQGVVADFIEEGHFATHIRRMRRLYAERHEVFQAAARRWFDGALEVLRTDSGFQTTGWLTGGVSAQAVAAAAAARGVVVSPVEKFCLEPIADEGLVLGFSSIPEKEIARGAAALAQVLEDPALRAA